MAQAILFSFLPRRLATRRWPWRRRSQCGGIDPVDPPASGLRSNGTAAVGGQAGRQTAFQLCRVTGTATGGGPPLALPEARGHQAPRQLCRVTGTATGGSPPLALPAARGHRAPRQLQGPDTASEGRATHADNPRSPRRGHGMVATSGCHPTRRCRAQPGDRVVRSAGRRWRRRRRWRCCRRPWP